MMWGAFLRAYGRVLVVAGAGAALLIAYTHQVHTAEQRGYTRATAEMQARIAASNAKAAIIEQQQRWKADRAAANWESQRNALQSQLDTLLARRVSVRVCKPAATGAVTLPAATEPAGQSHDGPVQRVDAVQMGPDVGDRVVQLAGECERYRQQLIALQAWVAGRP